MKIERLLKYMLGKKIYKMILSFTMMLMLFTPLQPVKAASSDISASTYTVMVHERVTVNANVFGNHMYSVQGTISSSDSSVLSGNGAIWKQADLLSEPEGFGTASASVTFIAQRPGTVHITFTPSSENSIDMDGNELDIETAQITITVVGADAELLQDKHSVDAAADIFVSYQGEQLSVVRHLDAEVPDTFEAEKITLHDQDIIAYHSSLMKLHIVYLSDENNIKNWYLYDPESETITSIYQPIVLLGRTFAIVDIPNPLQNTAGMKFGPVEIAGQRMLGWTFDDPAFANYTLVYLMDDQGRMQYYQYEKSERILQLYGGQVDATQAEYEASIAAISHRMIMIFALLLTNIITLMLLIFVMAEKRKRRIINMQELERFERMLYRDVGYDDITDFLLK